MKIKNRFYRGLVSLIFGFTLASTINVAGQQISNLIEQNQQTVEPMDAVIDTEESVPINEEEVYSPDFSDNVLFYDGPTTTEAYDIQFKYDEIRGQADRLKIIDDLRAILSTSYYSYYGFPEVGNDDGWRFNDLTIALSNYNRNIKIVVPYNGENEFINNVVDATGEQCNKIIYSLNEAGDLTIDLSIGPGEFKYKGEGGHFQILQQDYDDLNKILLNVHSAVVARYSEFNGIIYSIDSQIRALGENETVYDYEQNSETVLENNDINQAIVKEMRNETAEDIIMYLSMFAGIGGAIGLYALLEDKEKRKNDEFSPRLGELLAETGAEAHPHYEPEQLAVQVQQ